MRRAPAALFLVALTVAACGSTTPSSGLGSTAGASPSVPHAASANATGGSKAPSGTRAPTTPTASDTAAASNDVTPTPDASGEAPTGSGSPSVSPSVSAAAIACQPEGDNASFWPGIAESVSWDVYCAVLPKGWTVSGGSYRLANGGKLVISYKGPGGAGLTLSEGAFCADGSGCVPSGSDAGQASFGAMSGTLVATDAGGYAIVVARGSSPSWLMVTSGLDQATTVSLGTALARVGG